MLALPLFDWLDQAVHEPGAMRFYVQPALAILLSIRDGSRDARAGLKPFFYRLFFEQGERRTLLRSAWTTLALPLVFAVLLDSVLQILLRRHYDPQSSLAVGLLLVGLPYCLVRGLACRVATRRRLRREPV